MYPYEKAIELFSRLRNKKLSYMQAKECASICVDEIIQEYDEEILESNDVYRLHYWIKVRDYLKEI